MCSFEAPTVRLVLSHLRSVHSNDPQFNVMCGISGCARMIAPSVVFIRTSTDAIGQAFEVSLAALTLLATKIRLRVWRCRQSVSLVCKIIVFINISVIL